MSPFDSDCSGIVYGSPIHPSRIGTFAAQVEDRVFRERARTLQGFAVALDLVCVALAFGSAALLRLMHEHLPLLSALPTQPWQPERAIPAEYAVLLGTSALAWLISLRRGGTALGGNEGTGRLLLIHGRALAVAASASGVVHFALKMSSISRIFFGYYFTMAFLLLLARQLVVMRVTRKLQRRGFACRNALVIGAGGPACWFGGVVSQAAHSGYRLVGLLLTRPLSASDAADTAVLGTLDSLDGTLADVPVDEVFLVATSAGDLVELTPVAEKLVEKGKTVSLVAPLTCRPDGLRGRLTEFSGIPMISVGPMPRDEVNIALKRTMDVTIAGTVLLLAAPLMAAIALLIKASDRGPVLFAQDRLGVGARKFRLYKFRSMCVNAEAALRSDEALYRRYLDNDYKLPEQQDPRITKLGRWLRKTSLDELPQRWNVLVGDMSLVGPRPIVPDELGNYAPYSDLFLCAKSGLTGRWQVMGRSEISYPERAFIDLDYVGNNSILSDLAIIAKTIPAVVRRKGAF
jgi:exopolysaccharide biosynthesis polyprenyl glycosylphosphotransferase